MEGAEQTNKEKFPSERGQRFKICA